MLSDAFTEKFSSVNVKSNLETAASDEEKDAESDDDTKEMAIPFSVMAAKVGMGVAGELLVDPVYYGWRRALRIVGYLQSWNSTYKHKTHDKT